MREIPFLTWEIPRFCDPSATLVSSLLSRLKRRRPWTVPTLPSLLRRTQWVILPSLTLLRKWRWLYMSFIVKGKHEHSMIGGLVMVLLFVFLNNLYILFFVMLTIFWYEGSIRALSPSWKSQSSYICPRISKNIVMVSSIIRDQVPDIQMPMHFCTTR